MKKHYFLSEKIRITLLSVILFANLHLSAQCPTIVVNASASPTIFCTGTTSQLTATAGISGGGYTVAQIPFAPVAGSGTAVSLSDDQVSGMLPIGFNFIFFGNIYTQFNICSNGFISFNPANYFVYNLLMPAASPNNLIAGAVVDLNPPLGGTIEYFTTGSAPNRRLIVNFINIQHFPSGNPITLQYVLFETYNVIQIHTTSFLNSSATEGIMDGNGINYLVVPGRNNQPFSVTNDAWQFSPGNPNLSYSWLPTTGLSNPNISNPVASPTSSVSYTVTATDTNTCFGTAVVNLLVTTPPVSITASLDTVCAGSPTQLTGTVTTTSTANYTIDGIPYAPLTGAGSQVILTDDQVSAMLPIGFVFGFYGNYYTDFYVGSNGFITFDSDAFTNNYQGCCAGQALPNANFPNNLIAGAWEDLNGASGTVSYFTTGAFPNRKLVVNFAGVNHSPNVNPVTFQIILCETSNEIEIHTTTMPGNPAGYWWGHTEGIENATGTSGITVPGRSNNNTWTATNDAFRFTPYSPVNYSWTPASTISNDTIFNPLASPVTTTVYTLTATDGSGCTGNASITIHTIPLPAQPVVTFAAFILHCNYSSGIQWYLNGTIIPGATSPNYHPLVLGVYTVVYTDAITGCSSSSEPFDVTSLGIDENTLNINVSIAPNPFTDELLVSVDNSYDSEFILYDIASRKLMEQPFNHAVTINTEKFANGIYLYEIKNNKTIVKKGKVSK